MDPQGHVHRVRHLRVEHVPPLASDGPGDVAMEEEPPPVPLWATEGGMTGAALRCHVVLYTSPDGHVSVEGAGVALSVAASDARQVAQDLLSESRWDEGQMAWVSPDGGRVFVRAVEFDWEPRP